jgi:hypothetical protein
MILKDVAAPAGPTGESMCEAPVGVRATPLVEDGPGAAAVHAAAPVAAAGKETI